jgi:hypothetical protein
MVLPGKRWIVGVKNVMDEEYNQFDEVPLFGCCLLSVFYHHAH